MLLDATQFSRPTKNMGEILPIRFQEHVQVSHESIYRFEGDSFKPPAQSP